MARNTLKTIGVIGGLGPMASVYLTELITRMVDAKSDQEHPRMLVYSIPDTPDRTAFLLGESEEDPLPELKEAAGILEKAGADFLAIPCVTAQHFYDNIRESVSIPVISLCADVAKVVDSMGVKSVAILATDGTIKSGLLEKDFTDRGIRVILPEPEEQAEVMRLIYELVKTGRIDEKEGAESAIKSLGDLVRAMTGRGAEKVILGCTELSLIRRRSDPVSEADVMAKTIDILEVLADHAVRMSGAESKMRFR